MNLIFHFKQKGSFLESPQPSKPFKPYYMMVEIVEMAVIVENFSTIKLHLIGSILPEPLSGLTFWETNGLIIKMGF